MGRRLERIKNFLKAKKFEYLSVGIWEEAKDYLRDTLNEGKIVEVIVRNQTGFFVQIPGEEPDYYSRELLGEEFVVKTSTGATYIIEQIYDKPENNVPSDKLNIYDKDRNLIYTLDNVAQRKLTNNN